jgi:hypothetical protein
VTTETRSEPARSGHPTPAAPQPTRPRRCIVLPNGNRCGVATYVAAWHTLKTIAPDEHVKGFHWWPEKASRILRELRYGMHDRINRHDPAYGRGRKWFDDYQTHQSRDARRVNEYAARRIVDPINRLETPELQRRFRWSYGPDGLDITLHNRRSPR